MAKPAPLNKLLFIGLCILIAWTPLPFASDHLWSESLIIVVIMTFTFIWLSQYIQGKEHLPLRFKKAKLPLTLLLIIQLWVLVQSGLLLNSFSSSNAIQKLVSLVPLETLHSSLLGLSFIGVLACTIILANTESRIKTLLWVLIICGVIQATYGSLMVFSGYEYTFFMEKPSFRGSNVGTMFYRNQQAGYLVLCLSAGIGLMISDMKGGRKNLKQWFKGLFQAVISSKGALRVCLIIIVAGLVMTRSRMGNFSFALALGIAGVIYLLARKENRVSGLIFLASLIVVDIAVLGTFFDLEELSERVIATEVSEDGRALMTPQSWEAAKHYLPFGAGATAYYSAFSPFREHTFAGIAMTHAHNDYLEILLEYGIPGALLMVAFWLVCFSKAIRCLMFSKNNLCKGVGFAVVMQLIAIALHSSVDYNLQATSYPLSMMVLIGCLYSSENLTRRKKRKKLSTKNSSISLE